jgi:hypothetical protein
MNVRLQYDMTWKAGIWFENRLQLNSYQIELMIITNTSDPDDQINCMDRINHFIYEEMNDTIYINQNDLDQIALLSAAGIKITTLPESPIDQVIGWIVFLKLNSILENRMVITDIKIQSDLGDNIRYLHSADESFGSIESPGWWNDPSPVHSAVNPNAGKRRIVKLNPGTSWKKLDMSWSSDAEEPHPANTVVFAQFNKDDE